MLGTNFRSSPTTEQGRSSYQYMTADTYFARCSSPPPQPPLSPELNSVEFCVRAQTLVYFVWFFFFFFFCILRSNIITQYKPTKCAFPKLIFQFLIFLKVFYIFRTRGFVCRKTVVCAAIVWYVLHASV